VCQPTSLSRALKIDTRLVINIKLLFILGDPKQTTSIDDIVIRPLFVITNANTDEEELIGYVTEGGLSALANDPKGKDTYEALRRGDGTALLLHPSFLSSPNLKTTAGPALTSTLRVPNFAMLALLVSAAIRIPWLLFGGSKKNATSTRTFRRGDFVELCRLELSDHSVGILKALDQLPTSVLENL
jgi:hypothetical protein